MPHPDGLYQLKITYLSKSETYGLLSKKTLMVHIRRILDEADFVTFSVRPLKSKENQ